MTKETFLEELRLALQGNISQIQVNEQLQYYDNYITRQTRVGRSEEQVLEELGSPRLIAKTIIDTTDKVRNDRTTENYQEDTYAEQSGSTGEKQRRHGWNFSFTEEDGWDIRYGRFKINSWYGYLLIALIVVAVLVIAAHAFMLLLPVFGVIFCIWLVWTIIFGGRR